MRLHLLGIPHTITHSDYSHCAFTGKALRFAPMMRSVGYEVIHYGVGHLYDQESGANGHVCVMTVKEQDAIIERLIGRKREPHEFIGNLANVGNELYTTFNERLAPRLREHVQPGDAICLPFGHAHQNALTGLPDGIFLVETGIGYPTCFAPYRVFESWAWYHWHCGRDNRTGNDYHWVIPNYFDVSEWGYDATSTRDYLLYFGRINNEKGLDIVYEVARHRPDLKVVICGQGDPAPWLKVPNIEYHPPVSGRNRAKLYAGAIATIMPTRYVEPFGGVTVESLMSGVPVLGSSFGSFTETVDHGVNGYRCRTLGDFLAGLELVDGWLPEKRAVIARRAQRTYDMYTLAHQYRAAFQQLEDLTGRGWYTFRSSLGPITKARLP